MRTVHRCQEVIHRVAGQLVQEKKRKIVDGDKAGSAYAGKDLLSLLCMSKIFCARTEQLTNLFCTVKSNIATDLAPEQRISDEDILNNINTFMFAGSDTTSLSLTWTLLLLAENPAIQSRLRAELFSVAPPTAGGLSSLTEDEIVSLYDAIANLPFLHNVTRESLRLVPPVHSSLRVATEDDELPTMYPVRNRDCTVDNDRRSVTVPKGSFVHVAVEGFNLDKAIWGDDAWTFKCVYLGNRPIFQN